MPHLPQQERVHVGISLNGEHATRRTGSDNYMILVDVVQRSRAELCLLHFISVRVVRVLTMHGPTGTVLTQKNKAAARLPTA
jgi:hypothetical protein